MRIAVAGATGNIGARTVSFLERDGHFATTTGNLLAAEKRMGVRHHVLLSIVGISRMSGGTAHYAGKREQERLVEQNPVPWTIVPATQFHDLTALAAGWTERDGVVVIAPLLVQPIAPDDIAAVLAEIAGGEPQGRYIDVAGPRPRVWSTWRFRFRTGSDNNQAHVCGPGAPGQAGTHKLYPAGRDPRPVHGRQCPATRGELPHRPNDVRTVAGGRRVLSGR